MKKIISSAFLPLSLILLFGAFCSKNNDGTPVTGFINGLVRDTLDVGISAAMVVTSPATATVLTNDTGYFEIPDVPAGDYTVKASKGTYITDSGAVNVDSGQVSTVNFTLRRNFRTVLAEMLATACHCADEARVEAYGVKSGHPSRFVYMEYHASKDPQFDFWEPFGTPSSESRRLYYCDTFNIGHFMYFDGTILQTASGNFHATAESLMNETSPLLMQIAGTYSAATGTGHVDVTVTVLDDISYGDLYVEYTVYERGPMTGAPPPDTCPFRYVAVNMANSDPLAIAAGETQFFGKDFTVPDTIGLPLPPFHIVDQANIGVAVFVQSRGTKQVLQATFIDF
jgi:hypothetical protein